MTDELEKKERIFGGTFRQCFLVSGKVIIRKYKETITIRSTDTLSYLSYKLGKL